MNEENDQIDKVLSALANKTRRAIIHMLANQPATISMLADETNQSLPAIHKHIKLLEEAELIRRKKSGRTNFIALNTGALGYVQNWIAKYQTFWGSERQSLENYIEQFSSTRE